MQMIYKVNAGFAGPHALAVRDVSRVLASGGMALIPTETVYGLAASVAACAGASAPSAGYRSIFSLKQRDAAQTLPWLVSSVADIDLYAEDVPDGIRALAEEFWPGGLTIIVKAGPAVPEFMRAADGTVALRVSASPVVRELIEACGGPIVCTSANTHGAAAPGCFDDVEPRVLDGADVAVDAGATPCNEASTIVSLQDGVCRILRHGAVPDQDIKRVLART